MAAKTFTTGLAPDGNAPLLVLTHHLSPGGGTFTGAMPCVAYEVHLSTKIGHETKKIRHKN